MISEKHMNCLAPTAYSLKFYSIKWLLLIHMLKKCSSRYSSLGIYVSFDTPCSSLGGVHIDLIENCVRSGCVRLTTRQKKNFITLILYTANVCRELQGLCREIRVQGFQNYRDCRYTCNPHFSF